MARLKHEFPTEWSLCPDGSQEDWERPTQEKNTKDQERKAVEPRLEPRALAVGASSQ